MVTRKRILVIDNLAVESSRRGVYRLLAEQTGCDVHLLVPRSWKETTTEIECESEYSNALHLHTSRILFGYRHHRVVYVDIVKILKEVRPDFVLAVHAPENYATLQLLIARRLWFPSMKIGLFASRNIDLPSVGFPFKFAFLNRWCDWMTTRSKVDVVYHRPRLFGHLYQQYATRTVYIPHSVDCSVFNRHSPADHEEGGIVTLGYVGRLTEEKGVHVLIEALADLPGQARLVVVGEGPRMERLQIQTEQMGVAKRVKFEPPVSYASMPELLNRLDVLVLPSLETSYWKELFGRVLIEAMACEVPVAASDSGGIPDVVGDAGILVQSGSAPDLAKKLSVLIDDPIKRRELGKKGRERVLGSFDTQVVAETLAQDITRNLRP